MRVSRALPVSGLGRERRRRCARFVHFLGGVDVMVVRSASLFEEDKNAGI